MSGLIKPINIKILMNSIRFVVNTLTVSESCMEKINLLFAPTGDLQEISISNGWGEKFIEVSSKFDKLTDLLE